MHCHRPPPQPFEQSNRDLNGNICPLPALVKRARAGRHIVNVDVAIAVSVNTTSYEIDIPRQWRVIIQLSYLIGFGKASPPRYPLRIIVYFMGF